MRVGYMAGFMAARAAHCAKIEALARGSITSEQNPKITRYSWRVTDPARYMIQIGVRA